VLDRRQCVLIIGEPGCGKSYLSAWLASKWPSHRVWVYAPNDSKHFGPFRHFKASEPPPVEDNLIIIDDSAYCFTSQGFATRPYDWTWLLDVVYEGRHKHAHVIFNIQSIMDLWVRMRNLASRVYVFRLPPDDLRECVRLFGPRVEQAATLDRYEYIEIIRY